LKQFQRSNYRKSRSAGFKALARDKERLYRPEAQCISTNPESPVSCGNLSVPHAATVIDVTFYDDVLVQIGDNKVYYEVSGEEAPDYKQ